MPLFQLNQNQLILQRSNKFSNEKELQKLVETNLSVIFNCRFLATEFSTGPIHRGRIDSLALSEDNNPVIIEYKVVESSQLINQSLYYLSWIKDHKGDFEIAVQQKFKNETIEVDWSTIRVICIAPEYKKYDLHAVQMMGANIELWQYRYFENGSLFFEEIYKKSKFIDDTLNDINQFDKNPVMVEAGKKAAITRATGSYSWDEHICKVDSEKKLLIEELRTYILSLDEAIEEAPKKFYIAYKISQNFVCLEIQISKILLYLKIDPKSYNNLPENCKDVTNTGHFGTGNFEVTIKNKDDFEKAKEFILISYNNIGGN